MKEERRKKINKTKIFMFGFLNFAKGSGVFRIGLAIE